MVDMDRSSCDSKTLQATLAIKYVPTKNPYYVTFRFVGVSYVCYWCVSLAIVLCVPSDIVTEPSMA